jgi:hypothetical protein
MITLEKGMKYIDERLNLNFLYFCLSSRDFINIFPTNFFVKFIWFADVVPTMFFIQAFLTEA